MNNLSNYLSSNSDDNDNLCSGLTNHECLRLLCYLRKAPQCMPLCPDSSDVCEDSLTFRLAFVYGFIPLFCISIVGNVLNFLVYCHSYWRNSTTTRLLMMKTFCNLVYVCGAVISFLKAISWPQKRNEEVFWLSFPYVLFLMNTLGSISTWLTVLMTIETFVFVAFPVDAKQWCTMRNLRIAVVVCVLAAAGLQSCWPVSYEIIVNDCRTKSFVVSKYFFMREKSGAAYLYFRQVSHWLNALLVIILPVIVMIILTGLIIYHLHFKRRNFNAFSNRKRCITHLIFATAVCHLVLEGPNVAMFVYAALNASQATPTSLCSASVIGNFLSLINASILFLLYFFCSKKFRQLLLARLCSGHHHHQSTMINNYLRSADATSATVNRASAADTTTLARHSLVPLRKSMEECTNGELSVATENIF